MINKGFTKAVLMVLVFNFFSILADVPNTLGLPSFLDFKIDSNGMASVPDLASGVDSVHSVDCTNSKNGVVQSKIDNPFVDYVFPKREVFDSQLQCDKGELFPELSLFKGELSEQSKKKWLVEQYSEEELIEKRLAELEAFKKQHIAKDESDFSGGSYNWPQEGGYGSGYGNSYGDAGYGKRNYPMGTGGSMSNSSGGYPSGSQGLTGSSSANTPVNGGSSLPATYTDRAPMSYYNPSMGGSYVPSNELDGKSPFNKALLLKALENKMAKKETTPEGTSSSEDSDDTSVYYDPKDNVFRNLDGSINKDYTAPTNLDDGSLGNSFASAENDYAASSVKSPHKNNSFNNLFTNAKAGVDKIAKNAKTWVGKHPLATAGLAAAGVTFTTLAGLLLKRSLARKPGTSSNVFSSVKNIFSNITGAASWGMNLGSLFTNASSKASSSSTPSGATLGATDGASKNTFLGGTWNTMKSAFNWFTGK